MVQSGSNLAIFAMHRESAGLPDMKTQADVRDFLSRCDLSALGPNGLDVAEATFVYLAAFTTPSATFDLRAFEAVTAPIKEIDADVDTDTLIEFSLAHGFVAEREGGRYEPDPKIHEIVKEIPEYE